MDRLDTPRTVLRPFASSDWRDVMALAEDWVQAPGPAFDKWPTDGGGAKGLTAHFCQHPDRYLALEVKGTGRVVGLVALNGYEAGGEMDLGHVIHSHYQDNGHDLEALGAVVAHLFARPGLTSIIAKNADHPPQLAPLLALGFTTVDPREPGILRLTKEEWAEAPRAS